MSSQLPIISVVTPTFNRCDELVHLIHSLNDQTLESKFFELIICDDGSTDCTEQIIKNLLNEVNFNIKYIFQKNSGPGNARNNGVKNAKGELIIFTDSDCEAERNWLKNIYTSYLSENFDAFGGPDLAKDDFLPIQRAINYSMSSFFTTGGIRGHNKNMLTSFYPRTHNMGIKKDLFLKLGGFSTMRFGEDIEFSHRVYKEGAKVKLLDNVIVYHRRRTNYSKFFKQVYNSGVARINLGKRDSKMIKLVHTLPSIFTILSFFFFFFLFFSLYISSLMISFLFFILFLVSFIGAISEKSFILVPILLIVIPIQIYGYGIGFIVAFIKRYILKQDEFAGILRNFY